MAQPLRATAIHPSDEQGLKSHKPEFASVCAPNFLADPKRDGTTSEVFVMLNFAKKLVLIGGAPNMPAN